jgi:oligogalacturonide lyase
MDFMNLPMHDKLHSSLKSSQIGYSSVLVREVTAHPSLHHHPYFYVPAYDDAMRWLFFVSHRTGRPEAFAEHRPDKTVVQLTNREDLNEWSVHPSHDGRYLYYSAGPRLCRVEMETRREEVLADFGRYSMRSGGMVAAGMGTLSVSRDDKWVALPVCTESGSRLYLIETASGDAEPIAEGPSIFHPQFHPDDSSLIRHSGEHTARMWVLNRDGSAHRPYYQRDVRRKEWAVHESWIPGTRDVLAVDWPHGLFRVSVDDGKRTEVSNFNAWHPLTDRSGRRIVTDTLYPDRGICLADLNGAPARFRPICDSLASSRGDHWDCDHCPYDDGPVAVYAPQHTHPHPSFSPDGRYVVFTTDRSGVATVIEVDLMPDTVDQFR